MTREIFAGAISGTSADGMDCAICEVSADDITTLNFDTLAYSKQLKAKIEHCINNPDAFGVRQIAELDAEIGHHIGQSIQALLQSTGLRPGQVRAIGSHGQTVYHLPEHQPSNSLQLGNPAVIAEATGIDTVADFRRGDMAAGGQGAPLAPLLHARLLRSTEETRVVLNLGGIANITILPAHSNKILGFDTGPASVLMDLWAQAHFDQAYDDEGQIAASGKVDPALLELLLGEPYQLESPPKSTGRELYSMQWLTPYLRDNELEAQDVMATLSEFTAASVANAVMQHALTARRVIVCGGGVHNTELMRRIADNLDIPVVPASKYGVNPDAVEATLFAWLARQRVYKQSIDTCAITGARHPVSLGAIWSC